MPRALSVESLLRRHLAGMVAGFEGESRLRIPRGAMRSFVADTARCGPTPAHISKQK